MKVKSKLSGYPARRKAIKNVKDRFYFLYTQARSGGPESHGPLWGIALAFFILFQSCNNRSDDSILWPQQSYASQVYPESDFQGTGSLLFYTNNTSRRGFSDEYLKRGYRDDLYLRNRIPNAGKAGSSDQALSANTIHD